MKISKKKIIRILSILILSALLFIENDVYAAEREEYAKRVDIENILNDIDVNHVNTRAVSDDYRTWAQGDTRWGAIKLGTSEYTVKSSGCLVTSVTKLTIQSKLKSASKFTPETMVTWLNNNGGFTSGGGLYWGKPAELVAGFSYYGDLRTFGTYDSSKNDSQFISWINDGYHMVVQVKNGGHWVAVDEKKTLETGKVYIMDSLPVETNANADIKLADRYETFNRVVAYRGGKTPEVLSQKCELQVRHNSDNGTEATLKLKWNKVKNYTAGYRIYRTENKDDTWELIKEITDGDTVEWQDEDVESETRYFYKIQPFNSKNKGGSYSNIVEIETQHVHKYKRTVHKKASVTESGKLKDTCKECEHVKYVTISKINEVKIPYTVYSYNGKVRNPKVTVINKAGKKIDSKYYKVTYSKGCKNVGKYKVIVKFSGRYKGTIVKEFKIVPQKTDITKITGGSKNFTAKWKKVDKQISGYEIHFTPIKTPSDNFKIQKIGVSKTSAKINVVREKSNYYVKIRTYKIVDGVTYRSGWSEVKTIKTK